ncbi:MAG: DUF3332 domain-containing protein [Flavobacteriales bacterium]|jgi:hypothetical protein|nr:DUF3332 domain-containing protein [Flavobacteriales bacterium]MBK8709641.1 DUF3332 domain-containing protein [Flavobacteriales bacterium]
MKIIRKTALLFAMSTLVITQTGCFGEFALVRKVYEWNDNLSDSKFVKTLVFYVLNIIPVYGIASFIDVVILNLIEFWSGSNPLSMNEGDYEMQMATMKGDQFKMEATKDTFTTTQMTGEKAGEVRVMKFDRCDNTWKYTDSNVREAAIMTFVNGDADQIRVYTDNGSVDLTTADMADATALAAKFGGCDLALAK